ncbi:MAG: hypothetical protein HKN37_11560 [Rhodothermales bacterium]|nr:hypothetical protein [Rhodothermales bacterium]
MKENELPPYDTSDNPTNCCPRFNKEGWDERDLQFDEKLFLKAETRSVFHIPINMGSVFARAFADIDSADARNDDDFIVLSRDPSNWKGEHYFSVTHDVPGHEMVRLSGNYVTKVFEGPFREIGKWEKEMESFVKSQGQQTKKNYYFYTTCPKCAKVYGKNYVVGVAEVEPASVAA